MVVLGGDRHRKWEQNDPTRNHWHEAKKSNMSHPTAILLRVPSPSSPHIAEMFPPNPAPAAVFAEAETHLCGCLALLRSSARPVASPVPSFLAWSTLACRCGFRWASAED